MNFVTNKLGIKKKDFANVKPPGEEVHADENLEATWPGGITATVDFTAGEWRTSQSLMPKRRLKASWSTTWKGDELSIRRTSDVEIVAMKYGKGTGGQLCQMKINLISGTASVEDRWTKAEEIMQQLAEKLMKGDIAKENLYAERDRIISEGKLGDDVAKDVETSTTKRPAAKKAQQKSDDDAKDVAKSTMRRPAAKKAQKSAADAKEVEKSTMKRPAAKNAQKKSDDDAKEVEESTKKSILLSDGSKRAKKTQAVTFATSSGSSMPSPACLIEFSSMPDFF